MSRFKASELALPPSDPFDELVKTVEADCATLREKCWKMRELYRRYETIRREYEMSIINGTPGSLDDVMIAFRDCSALEREILNLRDVIEKTVETYNFGREPAKRICLSHTEEGLPIRVNKQRKVPLWGL